MDIKFCVSLTTIPSRIKAVYKTIETIQNQTLKPNKIYLNIPYKDKDSAKNLGARWDSIERKWYIIK